MKKYRFSVSLYSTCGNTRKINQDNFYINGKLLDDPQQKEYFFTEECSGGVFAVADGMGGEEEGEFASLTAVSSLAEINKKAPSYSGLCSCMEHANGIICERSERISARIGSTMVIAVINDSELSAYNIGDSKCLLYSGGKLTQLSKDHTVTAQMVEAGIMTPEQAMRDSRRHSLFQHLGMPEDEMSISLYRSENITLRDGDMIILCSDGLTDGLSSDDIAGAIRSGRTDPQLPKELSGLAMKNGSTDNITVLTISVSVRKNFFGLFAH